MKKKHKNDPWPDVSANADELAKKAADWMVNYIKETLKKQDRFTIALSGGNTPKKLHELLASDQYRDKIDWSKMHVFWGDERYVPFTDERNNAKMAFDTLLNHVPVSKSNIHIIRTDIEPADSAIDYEKILHRYFGKNGPSFDLVLLGLGDNGHTLSLFPGYENIHEHEKWAMAFYLKEQKMHRITLTTCIVERASEVAFLVAGADKAVTVYEVLYGEHNPDRYPAQLIQPLKQKPCWFIDKGAAMELEP